MSTHSSPIKSSHRKGTQRKQYPFCYFFLRFQNKFQFLRVEINPDFYSSFDQLKQHLSNHFSLNELPNLYLINENGKFNLIKDDVNKMPDEIANNSIFFVEPNGMTPESIFPDFAAKLYSDQEQNKNEKQKYIIPENILAVKKIFEDWSLLLQTIHKINAKNLNSNEVEENHKKDERRTKKKNDETEELDKKKIFVYTVQSLFTETGDFSNLFYTVANKMNIHISLNPKYGSPLRLKRKSSS